MRFVQSTIAILATVIFTSLVASPAIAATNTASFTRQFVHHVTVMNKVADNITSGIVGGFVVVFFLVALLALIVFVVWLFETITDMFEWLTEELDTFSRWWEQRPERKRQRAESLEEWQARHDEKLEDRKKILDLVREGKYNVTPLPHNYLYYFYGGIVNGVEYPAGYYQEPFWEWSSKWSKFKAARDRKLAEHIASVQSRMESGEYKMSPLPDGLHYFAGGTIAGVNYPEGHYPVPFWKWSWQLGFG